MTVPGANQIAEYLRLNPDATTPEVLGATGVDPNTWRYVLEDALASDEPHLALETLDTAALEGDYRGETPTLEADKPGSTTGLNQQSGGDDRVVFR